MVQEYADNQVTMRFWGFNHHGQSKIVLSLPCRFRVFKIISTVSFSFISLANLTSFKMSLSTRNEQMRSHSTGKTRKNILVTPIFLNKIRRASFLEVGRFHVKMVTILFFVWRFFGTNRYRAYSAIIRRFAPPGVNEGFVTHK